MRKELSKRNSNKHSAITGANLNIAEIPMTTSKDVLDVTTAARAVITNPSNTAPSAIITMTVNRSLDILFKNGTFTRRTVVGCCFGFNRSEFGDTPEKNKKRWHQFDEEKLNDRDIETI